MVKDATASYCDVEVDASLGVVGWLNAIRYFSSKSLLSINVHQSLVILGGRRTRVVR